MQTGWKYRQYLPVSSSTYLASRSYDYFRFSHVQVSNDDALAFYKNFGFEIVELSKNYYKRIEPTDAYLVEKPMKGQALSSVQPSIKDSTVDSDQRETKESRGSETTTVNGDTNQGDSRKE